MSPGKPGFHWTSASTMQTRPPRLRWRVGSAGVRRATAEHDMKAAIATDKGLAVRDIPQPKPKPNEVLVRVRAAALNRADLATARGVPHGSHGGIGAAGGLEWGGEGVEVGSAVEE